jgi:hypothetical protein
VAQGGSWPHDLPQDVLVPLSEAIPSAQKRAAAIPDRIVDHVSTRIRRLIA